MFRDGHAAGGDNQSGQCRDIVGAMAVAAGADDVDRVSGCFDPQHFCAHRGDRAGDLVDRFAAHAEPNEKCAHLRVRRLARQQHVEGSLRLGAAQALAGSDLGDEGFEGIHD